MTKKKKRKKTKKTRIKIAECFVGETYTKVYAVVGKGNAGNFVSPGKGKNCAVMNIGIDRTWSNTLATMLHEIEEMLFATMQLSFELVHAWSYKESDRLFVFTHSQFDEVMERVGNSVGYIEPYLFTAWEKYGGGKEKK